jgi:hypothetical protein
MGSGQTLRSRSGVKFQPLSTATLEHHVPSFVESVNSVHYEETIASHTLINGSKNVPHMWPRDPLHL